MSASNGDFVLPTSFGIQMTQESRSGLESEHCSIGVEDTFESDPLAAGDKEQSQQDHGGTQVDLVSAECIF